MKNLIKNEYLRKFLRDLFIILFCIALLILIFGFYPAKIKKVYGDITAKWKVSEIQFSVNPNLDTNTLKRAMNTWNESGMNFKLKYKGISDKSIDDYDGINLIYSAYLPNELWGGLCVYYINENNVIKEIDIIMNSYFSDYDLESMELHELGHALPLGHNDNPKSIMYPYLYNNEVKRNLYFQDQQNAVNLFTTTNITTLNTPKVQYYVNKNTINYFLDKKSNIEIYDILGRKIKSGVKDQGWNSEIINVSGVYFLGIDNRFMKLNIAR
jgi:hypothetical protein